MVDNKNEGIHCKPIRVASLSRVSTLIQGDKDKADIPMQKFAIREFISTHEHWKLVREYVEVGVSGFSKKASERDVIQDILLSAYKKYFDVLVVFMFDRIGRIPDETPQVVKQIAGSGVEIWSVKEGQMEFNNHTDVLKNFLTYWVAGGESIKISMRVTEAHEQMARAGLFHGGEAGFGYDKIKSGVTNKKGKELLVPVINPENSAIVKLIYDLVYYSDLGQEKIAKALNDTNEQYFINKKILSPKGSRWTGTTISYILRNPTYKGYPAYGKTMGKKDKGKRVSSDKWIFSDKHIPELEIVSPEIWDYVQKIRHTRNNKRNKNDDNNLMETRDLQETKLLLIGMIKCGICGNAICSSSHQKSPYIKKSGEIVERPKELKYRCSGKAKSNKICSGQTTFSQTSIEDVVLESIFAYFDKIKSYDFDQLIADKKKNKVDVDDKEYRDAKAKLEDFYETQTALEAEMILVIRGKSVFNSNKLQKLLEQAELDIKQQTKIVEKYESKLKEKSIEVHEFEEMNIIIPRWRDIFMMASSGEKKMMLSRIIQQVEVFKSRDKSLDEVRITLKSRYQQIYQSVTMKNNGLE